MIIDKIYIKDIEIKKSDRTIFDVFIRLQTYEFNCTPMEFVKNLANGYHNRVFINELKEATKQEDLVRIKFLLDELEKEDGD